MNNPTSGYDILYQGMSDEDRQKIAEQISQILDESTKQPLESLKKRFKDIVDDCYSNIIVNPWPQWLKENGSEYYFVTALAEHIWESMLKAKPSKIGEWKMRHLFENMKKNHGEDLETVCNQELLRENKRLQEDLTFERNLNRDRYR